MKYIRLFHLGRFSFGSCQQSFTVVSGRCSGDWVSSGDCHTTLLEKKPVILVTRHFGIVLRDVLGWLLFPMESSWWDFSGVYFSLPLCRLIPLAMLAKQEVIFLLPKIHNCFIYFS